MKRTLVGSLVTLGLMSFSAAGAEPADKCAACKLVTKAEMVGIMGELKGEPKCDTGLRPTEVTCDFDNMAGSWVKIRLYKQDPDQWSMQKNLLPNKTTPLPTLGKDGIWTKVGTDIQVYARKNGMTLEVDSSGGLNFAKAAAEKAYAKLK